MKRFYPKLSWNILIDVLQVEPRLHWSSGDQVTQVPDFASPFPPLLICWMKKICDALLMFQHFHYQHWHIPQLEVEVAHDYFEPLSKSL